MRQRCAQVLCKLWQELPWATRIDPSGSGLAEALNALKKRRAAMTGIENFTDGRPSQKKQSHREFHPDASAGNPTDAGPATQARHYRPALFGMYLSTPRRITA